MRRFNCGFLSTVSQLGVECGVEWSVELGVDSTVHMCQWTTRLSMAKVLANTFV